MTLRSISQPADRQRARRPAIGHEHRRVRQARIDAGPRHGGLARRRAAHERRLASRARHRDARADDLHRPASSVNPLRFSCSSARSARERCALLARCERNLELVPLSDVSRARQPASRAPVRRATRRRARVGSTVSSSRVSQPSARARDASRSRAHRGAPARSRARARSARRRMAARAPCACRDGRRARTRGAARRRRTRRARSAADRRRAPRSRGGARAPLPRPRPATIARAARSGVTPSVRGERATRRAAPPPRRARRRRLSARGERAEHDLRVGDGRLRAAAAERRRARARRPRFAVRRAARRRRPPSRCCRRPRTPSPPARAAARSARRRSRRRFGERLAVEHESRVRARAADVDRERVREASEARDVRGARHAARRTRERERRRAARTPPRARIPPPDVITAERGIPRSLAAAPLRRARYRATPGRRYASATVVAVRSYSRISGSTSAEQHDVGVDAAPRAIRRRARARASRRVRMKQRRSPRRRARRRARARHRARDRAVVERHLHAIGRRCARARRPSMLARHERRGMVAREIVERRAILARELEQVGGASRRARAPRARRALEQHVGRDGGAVHEPVHRLGHSRSPPRAHWLPLRSGRPACSAPCSARMRTGLINGDEVSERSADVDADRRRVHRAGSRTGGAGRGSDSAHVSARCSGRANATIARLAWPPGISDMKSERTPSTAMMRDIARACGTPRERSSAAAGGSRAPVRAARAAAGSRSSPRRRDG